MTRTIPRPPTLFERIALVWIVVSVGLAILPAGVGGLVRAVDVIAFMTLGPAVSLILFHERVRSTSLVAALDEDRQALKPEGWPKPEVVVVVLALGFSLSLPVVGSMVLLVLGIWSSSLIVLLVAVASAIPLLCPAPPLGRHVLHV